mgnify:CR=1 FL=1
MKVYKILVRFEVRGVYRTVYLTDGRDEGGHWFTYDRAVAERKLAELEARQSPNMAYKIV